MAPSRRQGQETRRGRQRANMPSRALQRPRPRALCSPGPHPARADRRKSRGPRARPQTQGRPLRPAPHSRALRFSLRSKPGGHLLLASPGLECRGDGERTSPPNSRALSSLPVGTRAKNRPRRREKGEKRKEKGDEGGERGLGVRPALGPPHPKRPALKCEAGEALTTRGRGFGTRRLFTNTIGCRIWRLHFEVREDRYGWSARAPRSERSALCRTQAARTRRGCSARKSGRAFCSGRWP